MTSPAVERQLLALPDSLRLMQVQKLSDESPPGLLLSLISVAPSACCPLCRSPSSHPHSQYQRTLDDLPCVGQPLQLQVRLRRFFCDNPLCSRRIFVEPLPDFAPRYAHRTLRQREALEAIGFTTGGRAGSRQARQLGLPVSFSTLLRTLRKVFLPAPETPRALGVDDWAMKKGERYGTILYDLEKRRVVDLLSDRAAETFAQWLKAHPGVEIVSRDRGKDYIRGAAEGAPSARPIADRFHLLLNAREALEKVLIRHHRQIRQAVQATLQARTPSAELPQKELPQSSVDGSEPVEPAPPSPAPEPVSPQRHESNERRERRLSCYRRIWELHAQGTSERAITRLLGCARDTVRRYLAYDTFPELAPGASRLRPLDPYADHLNRRWDEGGTTISQLWREVRDQGFSGSRSAVARYIARVRRERPEKDRRSLPSLAPPTISVPAPRTVAWMLIKEERLKPLQASFLEQLYESCPAIKSARELVLRFRQHLRGREWAQLDVWLDAAKRSGLPEMARFARSLEEDRQAVLGAMTYEWSNGPVEGSVNRLKEIKRRMYGRAKFDLLRLMVLHPS